MKYPDIPGYTIERRLGTGGMASVYLAVQETFGRQVALKVMAQHLAPDPSFGARFLREARIVAQMSHRNFVPVFDVGQHGDLHYMSMEYLPNGDLRALMQQGLPLADAIQIISDVASGLHYAASKNFVHRDIKPENILFREDQSAVITDFGIARDTLAATQMTQIGTIMGTPHYMSPEQAKAEEIDGRSDLYNLGIIVYEMLAGEVPYDAPSALATSIKHVNDPIPLLPPTLACFQPFIDRALAKDPRDRFQTGEEMIAALDTLEELEYQLISETVVRSRMEREDSIQPSPETNPTRLMSDPGRASERAATPLPRRRRRHTTGGLRADPDDADRRPAAMPAKSSAGPVFVLLLAATVAGAGAYYWQTYLRPPPAPAATSEAADQASPAAEPTPLQARPDPTDEISSLLDRAADDIEEYRLNSPAGNNAVEKYRQVLALSPGNSAAFDGLDNVATRYSHMAQTAIVDGRFDEATRYLKQAEQLAPENVAYLDAAAALAALPAAAATGANASALDPLPPLSVAELLTRAGQLGGPDTVDSGNFRKLAQLYQAVLAQEPEHPEATRGLDNSGRYAGDFAANSLRLGELRLAEVQIGYLQEIDPENERITPLEESLAQAILTRAQETGTLINTADDPASLAAAGLDVSQLLVAAETALEAPYPSSTDPADFRALGEQLRPARHQIEGARRLEPGNPAIAEAEARLGRRYAEVARELIELGDLAGARALLDEANSFAVTGPELAALQHLLASMETGAGPAQEKAIIEQIY